MHVENSLQLADFPIPLHDTAPGSQDAYKGPWFSRTIEGLEF